MALTRAPLRAVTAAEIAVYETDGVVCLRKIFPADWLAAMAEAVDAAMADPGPHAEEYVSEGGAGRFFGDLDLWKRHDAFRRFVFESPPRPISPAGS